MLISIGMSLLSAVSAGLIPSIKVCMLAPARYLK
jgi:putative ABC transport system permease protein